MIIKMNDYKWNKLWSKLDEYLYDFNQYKTAEMSDVENYCYRKVKSSNNEYKKLAYLEVIKYINKMDITANILLVPKELLMELFRLNYEEGYSKLEIMKMYINDDKRVQKLKELGNYDNEEWIFRMLGGNFTLDSN